MLAFRTFRNNTGLSVKRVVIGIVDSGIDPNYDEFSGQIVRIWDQILPGSGA
jgi:subtilisin family serine protease